MNKPTMWFTKSKDSFGCEMYYHLTYHLHLRQKETPVPLLKGSLVHDVMEERTNLRLNNIERHDDNTLFALAWSNINKSKEFEFLPDDDRDIAFDMCEDLLTNEKSKPELDRVIIPEFEFPIEHELYIWRAKIDGIIEDIQGHWIGEYKTTAYGCANVAAKHHKSPQPWVYLSCAKRSGKFPNILGVKMIVVSKRLKRPRKDSAPNVLVDPIPLDKVNLTRAETYMSDAATRVQEIESLKRPFIKDRNQCCNMYGRDCPFVMLCEPKVKEGDPYFNEITDTFFKLEDPENHLNIKPKEVK